MQRIYVYVLNRHGKPLMPCGPRKARVLLRDKRAKIVRRTPFTIQLLHGSTGYRQSVTLGIDAGSKHIGISATTENREIFAQEVRPRNDVVDLLADRRTFRRSRRNRKTRYRAPRFNNRVHSKHKGWLAPSVEVKIQEHITSICRVCGILPICRIVVETAEFDLQALKAEAQGKPKPEGRDYQHGEMFGFYNARQYVLWRDGYKCFCCGRTEGKLYVVNAEGKETGSPEDKHTICQSCFELGTFRPAKRRHWTYPTFMGIMRKTLMERLRSKLPDIRIEETTGAETKMLREQHGIEKSHVNDARCISGHPMASPCAILFRTRALRHHNRQLHRAQPSKGGERRSAKAPYQVKGFRLWDKVLYAGRICFIAGRRMSGSFTVKTFDWQMVKDGVTYRKLKLLEPAGSYITIGERRCVLL